MEGFSHVVIRPQTSTNESRGHLSGAGPQIVEKCEFILQSNVPACNIVVVQVHKSPETGAKTRHTAPSLPSPTNTNTTALITSFMSCRKCTFYEQNRALFYDLSRWMRSMSTSSRGSHFRSNGIKRRNFERYAIWSEWVELALRCGIS